MQLKITIPELQTIKAWSDEKIQLDVLRLDQIHPVVSGNKWFKLRYYLDEAALSGCNEIASFGGIYSNHIVATACAARAAGFRAVGFIRGEQETPTLEQARSFGMKIIYVSRTAYRDKEKLMLDHASPKRYWIPEGGYGNTGVRGAATILEGINSANYSDIICAVGSGTMMAGLVKGTADIQHIIGISSQKNNHALLDEIENLVADKDRSRMELLHEYHFGGFARYTPELIDFMKEVWNTEKIPTDIVYNAKLFFAVKDLIQKKHFAPQSKILIIHSGGLQGNCSLPNDLLPF